MNRKFITTIFEVGYYYALLTHPSAFEDSGEMDALAIEEFKRLADDIIKNQHEISKRN